MELSVFDVSELRIVGFITANNKPIVGEVIDLLERSFVICEIPLGLAKNNLLINVLPKRIRTIKNKLILVKYFIKLEEQGYRIIGYSSNNKIIKGGVSYDDFMNICDSIHII